jgi:hypothetical protein
MLTILLVGFISAAPLAQAVMSPSQLAFGQSRAFGLHACDPSLSTDLDSPIYCASVSGPNRLHRNFGDSMRGCRLFAHRVDGPRLDPKTELSFYVASGTVDDLACQLVALLRVPVVVEPETAILRLKRVHWQNTLQEAADDVFTAEDGTRLHLTVDSKKNAVNLVRELNGAK